MPEDNNLINLFHVNENFDHEQVEAPGIQEREYVLNTYYR